ncbi:hypothetical protein V3C99_008048 [Haemonchus contortus]
MDGYRDPAAFCNGMNNVRFGFSLEQRSMIKEYECEDRGNATRLCFCKMSSDKCNDRLWIEELNEGLKKCEHWPTVFSLQNTGDDYWQKIVNADMREVSGDYATKIVKKPLPGASVRYHFAYKYFSSQQQEDIYGSSTAILQLVNIFTVGLASSVVVLCAMITKNVITKT